MHPNAASLSRCFIILNLFILLVFYSELKLRTRMLRHKNSNTHQATFSSLIKPHVKTKAAEKRVSYKTIVGDGNARFLFSIFQFLNLTAKFNS